MANRPHVPKFGNWESQENVPYTVFFEKARKNPPGSTKMVNPNDPREEARFEQIPVSPIRSQTYKKTGEETRIQHYGLGHIENPVETKKQPIHNLWQEAHMGSFHCSSIGSAGGRIKQRGAADGFNQTFHSVRSCKGYLTDSPIHTPIATPIHDEAFLPNSPKSCCFPWNQKREPKKL